VWNNGFLEALLGRKLHDRSRPAGLIRPRKLHETLRDGTLGKAHDEAVDGLRPTHS
jgi:hypothetical protein